MADSMKKREEPLMISICELDEFLAREAKREQEQRGGILAIDPGNIESAAVLISKDYTPLAFTKTRNEDVLAIVKAGRYREVVIEMVASYGMAVGASVFETCVWIGRYTQAATDAGKEVTARRRMEVKMNICHDSRAKDSNIIQALIDRFAANTRNHGKGTKKEPGFFYGFGKDVWQAYALGVTHLDDLNF